MKNSLAIRLSVVGLGCVMAASAVAQPRLDITLPQPPEGTNDFHLVFRSPGISGYGIRPKTLAAELDIKATEYGDKVDFYWDRKLDVGGILTLSVFHTTTIPQIISGYWTTHDPTKPYDPATSTNIGVIDVKDIEVTAVPEPGTMAVLGLGLLALGRRRKGG